MIAATWKAVLRAPVKLLVMTVTWAALLVGGYALALWGFRFVYRAAGVGPFLLDRLWYLLLFVVLLMLVVSQAVTAYGTLIRSPETSWWLSLPMPARGIQRAKWLESSAYSAGAVLVFLLPVVLAYLRALAKPWWMLASIPVLLLPLLAIATAVSTILLLLWLRWIGRVPIRREIIPVAFLIICGILFWALGERSQSQGQEVWFVALQTLLPRMRVANALWLPSAWMAKALGAWINARWVEVGSYTALLWTTALVCVRLLDHVAAGILLPVLRSAQDGVVRESTPAAASPGTAVASWWSRTPFTACLVKDLYLLLRDPTQWSQGLVFFGILGIYFANLQRLTAIAVEPTWRIGVGSLNLACTLLVFGALVVRFVFPQVSLEGRRLWLVQITPGGLRTLLAAKLVCYSTVGLLIVESLLALSSTRLQIPPAVFWWLLVVGALASIGLVGLSVGFGALLIDPTATDAARVVSSSSGALTLLVMLFYVGGVSWTLVVAWSGWVAHGARGLLLPGLGLMVGSAAFGGLPVRQGLKRLERLEV